MCNLTEANAIYGFKTLDECAVHLPSMKYAGAVTNGEHGAMVFHNGKNILIPTSLHKPKPLDTNGAGDHFAAGVLYGLLNNLSLHHMAHLAHLCALDCIDHSGARPLTSLTHLIDESRKIAA
jgi:sugar/nucleoside kinase (ribokinase family)